MFNRLVQQTWCKQIGPEQGSAKGIKRGFEIKNRVSTCDTAATALWLLGVPVPQEMDGKPVTSAF